MNASFHRTRPASVPGRGRARGFTLIEMLVSLAVTLIMMGAVVTLFATIADSVSGSRSMLEISDRLRAARNQIQLDLQGATANPSKDPPMRPEAGEGYFEVIEGALQDRTNAASLPLSLIGDTDDLLAFTVRSRGAPFVGTILPQKIMVESPLAEVLYFLKQDGPTVDAINNVRLFTLYRRVLLVAPWIQPSLPASTLNNVQPSFFEVNDLSARTETIGGSQKRVLNSLSDLTKPENRFKRDLTGFRFPFRIPSISTDANLEPLALPGNRLGDDVLLTNVIAFDVQVWDPGAPIVILPTTPPQAVEPRDPGYPTTPTGASGIFGAFVDLGYATGYTNASSDPASLFCKQPHAKSVKAPTTQNTRPFTYDTWSTHFENDGQIQNATIADMGANGIDDGGAAGVVDDANESDTVAPYPAPLNGVRITIRVYEPSSKQVREAVVVQHFVPE